MVLIQAWSRTNPVVTERPREGSTRGMEMETRYDVVAHLRETERRKSGRVLVPEGNEHARLSLALGFCVREATERAAKQHLYKEYRQGSCSWGWDLSRIKGEMSFRS